MTDDTGAPPVLNSNFSMPRVRSTLSSLSNCNLTIHTGQRETLTGVEYQALSGRKEEQIKL